MGRSPSRPDAGGAAVADERWRLRGRRGGVGFIVLARVGGLGPHRELGGGKPTQTRPVLPRRAGAVSTIRTCRDRMEELPDRQGSEDADDDEVCGVRDFLMASKTRFRSTRRKIDSIDALGIAIVLLRFLRKKSSKDINSLFSPDAGMNRIQGPSWIQPLPWHHFHPLYRFWVRCVGTEWW